MMRASSKLSSIEAMMSPLCAQGNILDRMTEESWI